MFAIYLIGSFIAMIIGASVVDGKRYFESKNAFVVFNIVAAFTWPIGVACMIGGWLWDHLVKER
jgi:hypothetical protein